MARPLHVVRLLSRVGAPSPPASINSCRLASRGAMGQNHGYRDRTSHRAPRHSDGMSDEGVDIEDVEEKLQALVDEERRRRTTVKYHMMRRKVSPRGAPQRTLNWDAIEQIRYLKQERPDEWTVDRLAEGFSVTPDVILRILRSKFVPTSEIKAKQNAKVMQNHGQQVQQVGAGTHLGKPTLLGKSTQTALPPGSGKGTLVPVTEKTLLPEVSTSLTETVAVTVKHRRIRTGFIKDTPVTEEDTTNYMNSTEDREDEETWDGWVVTEEELEKFREMEKSPVKQVGNEFFDVEGNLLYRI
ncbi:neugrin [Antennarius striatus]|uniref:neugrin n=1 Tax=Antennarius striatus TaxID=241820 RepID=UPI0035B01264